MAYFVVYEHVRQDQEPIRTNVILRRTHPVLWAANPPAAYEQGGFSARLLFWAEISDDIPDKVGNWCGVED